MITVEVVARALYPDAWPNLVQDPNGFRNHLLRNYARKKARAALAAIRTPTPGMVLAMAHPFVGVIPVRYARQLVEAGWKAAIDTAMEE